MIIFKFFPASGERWDVDLGRIAMTGRMSRSGRRVLVFPAPFDSLEITEGERVGAAKMVRIKNAANRLIAAQTGADLCP